jgi:hypothetical protein
MDPAPPPSPWIRRSLILFPAGLIVLGTGSMIWHVMKKQVTAERSIRYAAGLSREINAADLSRYEKILTDNTDATARASFVESTLGPENMGYTVRKLMGTGEAAGRVAALDIELTGTRKPRDIVLLLTHYTEIPSGAPTTVGHARAAALAMAAAHSMTGTPALRSIRFVSIDSLEGLKRYYERGIGPGERISHIVALGQVAAWTDEDILTALHLTQTGTVIEKPSLSADPVAAANELKQQLRERADRL